MSEVTNEEMEMFLSRQGNGGPIPHKPVDYTKYADLDPVAFKKIEEIQEADDLRLEYDLAVPPCAGCGQRQVHKMCPAWGTPLYMSGVLFTKEHEEQYREMREEAIRKSREKGNSGLD